MNFSAVARVAAVARRRSAWRESLEAWRETPAPAVPAAMLVRKTPDSLVRKTPHWPRPECSLAGPMDDTSLRPGLWRKTADQGSRLVAGGAFRLRGSRAVRPSSGGAGRSAPVVRSTGQAHNKGGDMCGREGDD